MFWAGLLLGGVIGWALTYFRILPVRGVRFFYTLPMADLDYSCGNKEITGRVSGTSPWPLFIYGHAWPSTDAYVPDPHEPHGNANSIAWGGGTGNFTISEPATGWPNSGTVKYCVWALHASDHVEKSKTCGGSAVGAVTQTRQARVGTTTAPVHDKGADAYSVQVSHFQGEPLQALNREWLVKHQADSNGSLLWTNGGDAAERPYVGLLIESVNGADVICTLKLGSLLLEYKLDASRWRPLSENQLFLVGGNGTDPRLPLPDRITVAPAL